MARPVLTSNQRKRVLQRQRASADAKLARTFRKTLPPDWLPQTDRELVSRLYHARDAADRFGLKREDLLAKWLYISATVSPYFWRDPATADRLLRGSNDPNTRFMDYYALLVCYYRRAGAPFEFPPR